MDKPKNDEMRSFDSVLKTIGIVLAVLGMVLTIDWTARQLTSHVPPFTFPIPADACVIHWQPRIVYQNTTTRTQTYIRTDGARVTVTYGYSDLTGTVTERGREVQFGGECSVRAVKGNG